MTRKSTQKSLWMGTVLKGICFLLLFIAFMNSTSAQENLRSPRQAQSLGSVEAKANFELSQRIATTNDVGLPDLRTPVTNSPTAVCATFTGSFVTGDPTFTSGRLNRNGVASSCAVPKTCPGNFNAGTVYRYKTYTYTNPLSTPQCVTVTHSNTGTAGLPHLSIHNGAFNTADICTNYLADRGTSPAVGASVTFSFTIPGSATVTLVVTETAVAGLGGWTITLDLPLCSGAPCTGTPTPGNTISNVSSICPSLPFNLTLQNSTPGAGVTYQWQSSSTLAGPYTNITGANGNTYSTSLTASTYYRAEVTCSGNTGTSTPVLVSLNPPSACYCAAGGTSTSFEKISNVTYAGINRTTTSTAPYENWITDTATVTAGQPTQMSVSISGAYSSDQVLVWADINHDGDFNDAGELLYTSPTGVGPHVFNVTIPANALTGYTRLRVRMHDSSLGANSSPCGNSSYGQVEDYTINVLPCVQGVIVTQPVARSIQCGNNTTFTVAATGTALTYRWEYRTSPTAPWQFVTNGGFYSGATTNTLSITTADAAINGYEYRAVIDGGCTATIFSNTVALTVTNLVATVSPSSATICAGAIQSLTITNTAPPSTSTFNSGAVNVAIPEGTFPAGPYLPGISNITSSGIPAGAVITGISVRLNITHAYVGDVVAVLKAPNGNIFNLDALLTRTNNAGANFVNTVISSAGTTLLSAGTAPFTNTFKADAAGATFVAFGFTLPGGPIGYIPNVTTWNGLYSTPNGVWTLAMYDAGAPDVGSLTSWSLIISYGAPSTGTFTGPAGTIFTDATATTPYVAGTAINQVFVKPSATSTYKVVVTTPTCVSDTTNVLVTVNNPITGVTSAKTVAGCANGGATITVNTTGGSGIAYQWRVSSTGAAGPYTAIANGGNYSGATTNTLTINSLPANFSNYRYYATLSNACGTVSSDTATLTVNPNPTIVVSASPSRNLYPGQTTTLTAAASPAGNYTYTWYRNGVVVPGTTGNMLTVGVDEMGLYTVRATNSGTSCTSLSAATAIGDSLNTTLFIYPSPSNGMFQVRYYSLPGNTFARMLNVYDAKGARVYSRSYSINAPYGRMDVDMTNYQSGLYMVELIDNTGNRLKTGTVLIY